MNRFKKSGFLAAALGVVLGVSLAYAATYPYLIAPYRGMGARHNTLEFAIQVPSAGAAAIFAPGTTNTNALGSTLLRFSNVFTTLLNVSGLATFSGGLTVSQANVSVQLSTAPRTSTTLVYGSTGTLVFNTTDNYLVISTSSNQASFVIVSSTFTASAH